MTRLAHIRTRSPLWHWAVPGLPIWTILLDWQRRHASRLELDSLDDRMLEDIGLCRFDAEREAAKPFWRA